jgi:hypothetical protein
MIMNTIAKLVLAGALTLVSVPAMARDRHHGRHHDNDRGRHHERDDHRNDRGRHGHDRGHVRHVVAPAHHQVWVPGHWVRRGPRHFWVAARWTMPPQPTWVWVAPQWVWTGVTWQWQEGHWSART